MGLFLSLSESPTDSRTSHALSRLSALDIPAYKVGDFDTELVQEFLMAFVREAKITLHIRQICGVNSHHIIEGAFKAVARVMRKAVKIDAEVKDEIPSTKGVL